MAASNCTYDRIIVTAGLREDYAKEAGVFRFDAVYGLEADAEKKRWMRSCGGHCDTG